MKMQKLRSTAREVFFSAWMRSYASVLGLLAVLGVAGTWLVTGAPAGATADTSTVNAVTAGLQNGADTAYAAGLGIIPIVIVLFAVLVGIGFALKVWKRFRTT